MAFAAKLETASGPNGRTVRLWLNASSAANDVPGTPAWIHISTSNGLVIEAEVALHVGDEIEIVFSTSAHVSARIIWAGTCLFGCLFGERASLDDLPRDAEMSVGDESDGFNVHEMLRRRTDFPLTNAQGETLGMRLRQLRTLRGIMQDEVAAQLGVSVASVSHWESDRSHPKRQRLTDLATLLGVASEELICFYRPVDVPKEIETGKITDLLAAHKLQVAKILGVQPDQIRIMIEP